VSPFEATVVKQLKDAGCIIMGKTNMDEFGMGFGTSVVVGIIVVADAVSSHSTFSIHGAVRKPGHLHMEALSAGGSSGGSAAAVAAGMCDMYILHLHNSCSSF
jgi:aspartyl-tRNA(Asn)/glutamyl-tRNA(Gln) amidotransferase subunit A